jgi:hypothetical protein
MFSEIESRDAVDSSDDDNARGDQEGESGRFPPGHSYKDKFWERLGFESFTAYMEYLEYWQNKDAPKQVRDLGAPSLSTISREALDQELTRRRGYRQIGVKLKPGDYESLRDAARAHGIASSTLARMLTARGARILAAEAARSAEAGTAPPAPLALSPPPRSGSGA